MVNHEVHKNLICAQYVDIASNWQVCWSLTFTSWSMKWMYWKWIWLGIEAPQCLFQIQEILKSVFLITLWVTVTGHRSTRVTGGRHCPLRTAKSPPRLMAIPALFLSRLSQFCWSLSSVLKYIPFQFQAFSWQILQIFFIVGVKLQKLINWPDHGEAVFCPSSDEGHVLPVSGVHLQ